MKTASTVLLVMLTVFLIWLYDARRNLLEEATLEAERICEWIEGSDGPDALPIGGNAGDVLISIQAKEGATPRCRLTDNGFNLSVIETSIIISVDQRDRLGLRYGRILHGLTPLHSNGYLGYWTLP
jgi:hypothetical protein